MKTRPKKLSFGDAMLTNGGYLVFASAIVLSMVVYLVLHTHFASAGLVAVGCFILLYPAMLEAYREKVNERIVNGEFDDELDKNN